MSLPKSLSAFERQHAATAIPPHFEGMRERPQPLLCAVEFLLSQIGHVKADFIRAHQNVVAASRGDVHQVASTEYLHRNSSL